MQMVPRLARGLTAFLVLAGLSTSPVDARTWYQDASGNVVGSPPKTPLQLLEFCVANSERCSISVNHLSKGW